MSKHAAIGMAAAVALGLAGEVVLAPPRPRKLPEITPEDLMRIEAAEAKRARKRAKRLATKEAEHND